MFCSLIIAGMWELRKDHAYYYQVQTQLNVVNCEYGDFVVWTEKETIIERIQIDRNFHASNLIEIEHFFLYSVLPEVVGKWITRKNVAGEDGIVTTDFKETILPTTSQDEDDNKNWCFCGQPSYGEMIMCESDRCAIEWFHFDCMRFRAPPKGKWYCPSCRRRSKKKKKSNS